jgi:hypothetical protein
MGAKQSAPWLRHEVDGRQAVEFGLLDGLPQPGRAVLGELWR